MEKYKLVLNELHHKVEKQLSSFSKLYPYIVNNNEYDQLSNSNPGNWTNGFYPGILWQLNHFKESDRLRAEAIRVEEALDQSLNNFQNLDHDVGFLWLPPAYAHYLWNGNLESLTRVKKAGIVLASRFNPVGNYLRCWNGDTQKTETIIDSLMNLPLLFEMSRLLGDKRFFNIASAHAKTLLRTHLRSDDSTYHVGKFDEQGEFMGAVEGQGYSPESVWSRGQAWAIYGFATCYKYTHEVRFLDGAKHAANFFIAQVAKTNFRALVDFRAPEQPIIYDTSATACAVCGIFEIANHCQGFERSYWESVAKEMLDTLLKSDVSTSVDKVGILQNATSAYFRENEREKSIIYGDYFLVEALSRAEKNFVKIF